MILSGVDNSLHQSTLHTMASNPTKRPRFVEEPVFIEKDGETRSYIPSTITTGREAYAASLDMMFHYVADFHMAVVEILSDKTKIPVDELFAAVKSDPRYIYMHERVNTLGYVPSDKDTKTVPASVSQDEMFEESDEDVSATTQRVSALTLAPPAAPAPAAPKPRGRPRKTTAPVAAAASAAPATASAKKTIRVKKTAS